MADQKQVDAALAWADRLERGEEPGRYDPWIVALAGAYRDLQAENERLDLRVGLDDAGREIADELRAARARIETLERLIRTVAAISLPFGDGDRLELGGDHYKIVPDVIARALVQAVEACNEALRP